MRSPRRSRDIGRTLREVFGLTRLRPGQREVIERVLAGQPTLAVMPTGAGKSLCYQLPALLQEGVTLVVSPLVALMKDQCEKLQALGVPAVQLNSQLDAEALHAAERAIGGGQARIVLTTPERLGDAAFMGLLQGCSVSLLVVDEAHCISEWGHDFRPAFLEIETARERLGRPPVLALTATATEEVARDVMARLHIPPDGLLGAGIYRPNLRYSVEQFATEEDKLKRLLALVAQLPGSGIVYAATVRAAEAAHEALLAANVDAGLYHGRCPAARRHAAQDDFMGGKTRIMVATNAFGMGIDKPDIRFVLHLQLPAGLGVYYQESGRAGRDGAAAECLLLFVQRDKAVQQFFMAGRYPDARDLEALYGALSAPPADAAGWTLAALREHLALPRAKLDVALGLLQRRRVVSRAAGSDVIALCKPGLMAPALAQMLEVYQLRREQDRETLERMVHYAQAGQCRWQLLLAEFGQHLAGQGCGRCDNCQRIARHQAEMAQAIVIQSETGPAEVAGPGPAAAPRTPFAPEQVVQVRRYGRGRVVSADALSVTIEFADGIQRAFLPDFVKAARGLRRPAQPPQQAA